MRNTWTYRWAGSFFSIVLLACLIALPFAAKCCSRFSADEVAFLRGAKPDPWSGWFARTLLDWPMGFRLLVMTVVAAAFCLLAIALLFLIDRLASHEENLSQNRVERILRVVARAAIASLMVGVLFILQIYYSGYIGYVGYVGYGNGIALFVTSSLIAFMEYPRRLGWLLGLPLFVLGLISAGAISYLAAIPLD